MTYNYKTLKSPRLAEIIQSIVMKYINGVRDIMAMGMPDDSKIVSISTDIKNDVYNNMSSCICIIEDQRKFKYYANFKYHHDTGDVLITLTHYSKQFYATTFTIDTINDWAAAVVNDLMKATITMYIESAFTVLVTGG